MSIEYRHIKDSEFDALAWLESLAFYGRPRTDDGESLRKVTKPEWTLAAFDGGKPIASVRSIPAARLMHGTQTPFALISPATCQAAYRRQGHVAKLLRQSLELMKERGQPISGLYTPHDSTRRALQALRLGASRGEAPSQLRSQPARVPHAGPARQDAAGDAGQLEDARRHLPQARRSAQRRARAGRDLVALQRDDRLGR